MVDYSTRPLNPHRLDAIRKYAGSTVLDVGCGNGAYVFALRNQYQIKGTDYREFDDWARQRDLFAVANAHSIHETDNSIETVVSFEVLEHLDRPREALAEFYRVCKKNIILTVPNCELSPGMKKSNLIFHHWIDPTHVNFFNRHSLKTELESIGFKNVRVELVNQINIAPLIAESLYFGHWLSRLLEKLVSILPVRKYPMTLLAVAEK